MAYTRHHAIVVTSWDEKRIKKARKKAKEIGLAVTSIAHSPLNGFRSFLIAPDGSNEGWEDSDVGDQRRSEFWDYVERKRFPDGGSYLSVVEVFYGDDNRETGIAREANRDQEAE